MQKKEAMAFLDALEAKGIMLGLGRIKKFLRFIGNPERQFNSVHIAGSKGKGSTAAMLESILRKAGYRTGLYTSPHLVRFNERIQVNGRPIGNPKLTALVSELRAQMLQSKIPLSYFEFTTALAFMHFADRKVDFAVVETGMGGRLDATNALLPRVCIITNIEREHSHYLGSTLEKIALEKAGIIKQGIPVVVAERKKSILGIFKRAGGKKKAALRFVKKPFVGKLGLLGSFQRWNAATAIAAIQLLQSQGFAISEKAISAGLAAARWPGRFQIVQRNPTIVLDCCHTPNSALALANAFREIFPKRKAVLVIGASSDKGIRGIAVQLSRIALCVVATESKTRPMQAEKIISAFEGNGIESISVFGVKNAVRKGIGISGKKGIVLVAGSCFVAGEAMGLWKRKS